ncbi:transporter substrate-binding domain-containing protein [Endozoicomonas sp. SM1973]|uniref:Transporter substrate-binding domain-containing protein n=1 Tax=Spartinivicinus marinus TaxID=2994442 RepID=A0A853IM79_9GAMM|nr:transporter substrate-binding domain-containing protein [Spartinivicinus marinus]
MLGGFYKKEREEYFLYSTPISKSIMALYTKKGSDVLLEYKSLEELKGYLIGVVRGYHYTDSFAAASYLTKLEEVHSEVNLKLLYLNRIHIIAGSRLVLHNLTERKFSEYKGQLIELKPPLKENSLYVLFAKQAERAKVFQKAFEKGLVKLKQSGKIAEIMAKHGFADMDVIGLE